MVYTKKDIKKYDKEIIGSFGDFETSLSYELNYLMATLDIKNINDLSSASQVLSLEDTNFEELIQRDIDYKRIDEQIVKHYLEKGKDKVIFFPPLLVSPMVVRDGKPLDKFNKKTPKTEGDELFLTWDDIIQLSFPINKEAGDGYPYKIIDENGDKVAIYNYATTLKYNSDSIKLVVIDGQHRFMALKRIWDDKEKRDILSNIKIPLCIFFTPNAVEGNNTESLTRSMRQLFVVINSTAKQVSGHFITLLNDDSLTSYAVRDFADYWKSKNNLFFLEWNEREDKRASQVNKKYSITTIKILETPLKDYIFKNVITKRVLRLNEVASELKKKCIDNGDNIDILEVSDDNFSLCQVDILKEQLRKTTTNLLNTLFLEPELYKIKKEQFTKALNDLDNKVKNNINGARYFRDDVLYQFRETSNYDPEAPKAIEKEFLDYFSTQPEHEFYFKNIFQQAYIRALMKIYNEISIEEEIKIEELAKVYIQSIKSICFDDKKQLFSYVREYTQNVFYKNARILVNNTAKLQLVNLILSIFLNQQTIKTFAKEMGNDKYNDILTKLAQKSSYEYFDAFKKNNINDMKKNWRSILDSDDPLYNKFDDLERNAKDKESKSIFEKAIAQTIENKYEKAKKIYFNILEISDENSKF